MQIIKSNKIPLSKQNKIFKLYFLFRTRSEYQNKKINWDWFQLGFLFILKKEIKYSPEILKYLDYNSGNTYTWHVANINYNNSPYLRRLDKGIKKLIVEKDIMDHNILKKPFPQKIFYQNIEFGFLSLPPIRICITEEEISLPQLLTNTNKEIRELAKYYLNLNDIK